MDLYRNYSKNLMDHLKCFSQEIEPLSIDECFLNMSFLTKHDTDPVQFANTIRESIFEKFHFTVNIGISDKKVLAKMASDFEKPNKTHTLYCAEIKEKMWPLPVSDLYMCGKASNNILRKLEILTIGDLAKSDLAILELHLKSHGKLLWEYANGIDPSTVVTIKPESKGIGNSITLQRDIIDIKEIYAVLLNLSESVAKRLRDVEKQATSITVEIKYFNFLSTTHKTLLDYPTNSTNTIYEISKNLLEEVWTKQPIRLLGIRCTKLSGSETPVQLTLFDYQYKDSQKQKNLDLAIDNIREKFGDSAIIRGSLFPPKKR